MWYHVILKRVLESLCVTVCNQYYGIIAKNILELKQWKINYEIFVHLRSSNEQSGPALKIAELHAKYFKIIFC